MASNAVLLNMLFYTLQFCATHAEALKASFMSSMTQRNIDVHVTPDHAESGVSCHCVSVKR
jgi:hypothetical protein